MGEISFEEIKISSTRKPPLCEQLKQRLQKTIEANGLCVGDKLPPIYTLTKKWNVNYRTLRSAFNMLEDDGLITYEPNRGAVVACDINTQKKIAIRYIRWQRDGFCVAMSNGIKRFCSDARIEYEMVDALKSHDYFIDAIRHPGKETKGLLVAPEPKDGYAEAIKAAFDLGVHVVVLDRNNESIETSSVSADHFTGAYQAVEHLIETHGRPVYYLGRVDKPSSCKLWVQGWTEAMKRHNYFDLEDYKFDLGEIEDELMGKGVPETEFVIEAAIRLFKAILNKDQKYSIFAGNNYVARGIYIACEEFGLEVGKDVYVVAYGDALCPETFSVPLSNICQNTMQVGYTGAKVLYEKIIGSNSKIVHRLIPTELMIRQSSLGTV